MTPLDFAEKLEHTTEVKDLSAPLQTARDIIERGFADNFASQSTAEGVAWPPRKSKRFNHPLLLLTGTLKKAATGESKVGHIERIQGNEIEVGVVQVEGVGSLMGSRRHQQGDNPQGIRPRPYIGISEETETKCAEAVGQILAGKVFE
jgi:hypothetical protein